MHRLRLSCKRGEDAQKGFVLVLQFMLPDAQNTPAASFQLAINLAVPRLIFCELPPPVWPVAFWHPKVLAATMPETAVNKHRHIQLSESEIRFAGQCLISPPADYPVCPEDFRKPQFSFFVSFGFYRGHDL
jgi:hypothetical protein